jgi:hypothetical protein
MNTEKIGRETKGQDAARVQTTPGTQEEVDPYEASLVSRELRILKAPVAARVTGILTNLARNRNLRLIDPPSRAVRANDVHELSCTTEHRRPGDVVQDVGYLAFVVFDESGVLASGDILQVDGRDFGVVLGFNQIHSPNHLNVVVRVESLTTGLRAEWQLDTPLSFKRPDLEGQAFRNPHRTGTSG